MPRQKAAVQRKPTTKAVVAKTTQVPSKPEPEKIHVETPVEDAKAIELRLQETINELKDFKAMVNGMTGDFINRLSDAVREIKQLRKTQKKPRPTNVKGPKKPSTFEVPYLLSDSLCAFLKIPSGSLMSRNDVTHAIHKYCKENGLLQNGDNRIINPDAALLTVLSPMPPGEQLTYFVIQRYLKHNYTAAPEAEPVAE